jgi:hypothetical protein
MSESESRPDRDNHPNKWIDARGESALRVDGRGIRLKIAVAVGIILLASTIGCSPVTPSSVPSVNAEIPSERSPAPKWTREPSAVPRWTPEPSAVPKWTPEPSLTPEWTAQPSQPSDDKLPPPPSELVGKWNGGPGDSSDWWLSIRQDGSYTLMNDWLGLYDEGVVGVSHSRLDFQSHNDPRAPEMSGIQGCGWDVSEVVGMTSLSFCGMDSTFVR